jgi:hypothetical protein
LENGGQARFDGLSGAREIAFNENVGIAQLSISRMTSVDTGLEGILFQPRELGIALLEVRIVRPEGCIDDAFLRMVRSVRGTSSAFPTSGFRDSRHLVSTTLPFHDVAHLGAEIAIQLNFRFRTIP